MERKKDKMFCKDCKFYKRPRCYEKEKRGGASTPKYVARKFTCDKWTRGK